MLQGHNGSCLELDEGCRGCSDEEEDVRDDREERKSNEEEKEEEREAGVKSRRRQVVVWRMSVCGRSPHGDESAW